MVQEHRARGYQVPQTNDFVSDFKKLRLDICASASSCDEVDGSLLVNRLTHYLLYSHSLTCNLLHEKYLCIESENDAAALDLIIKRIFNLLPDAIRRIPEHLQNEHQREILNQLLMKSRSNNKMIRNKKAGGTAPGFSRVA
jgi:hypothetical protein